MYAVLSPMMSCEEGWLLGKYVRSIDPAAVLILGPAPTSGQDEVFKHYLTGNLCRCATYPEVMDAVKIAAKKRKAGATA